MDKTFTLVGVSTQNKAAPKFRVANGDMANRIKVLTRAGHTAIDFMQLDQPMSKLDAIAVYKAAHPEAADIRMPSTAETKTAKVAGVKTVSIKAVKGSKKKTTDAATELLNAVETAE